jgi:DNA-binding PadR family transcriptional regulator
MQHQHYAQARLSRPAYLILASLAQEPKHAIALQEVIEQSEGLYIEPGTFYRVLAQLEQRVWIEALTIEQPLRLYQITTPGYLAFERAGAGRQGEWLQEGGHPGLRKRKEIIMRLALWILHLYPPAWRERYEAETVALLEQHQITLWTVLDLLVGALDARLDPHYRRARQLLPLRRFQTSWRLAIAAFVAFWIALLPWFWLSLLGIGPDTECAQWGNNYALCMVRVTMGMHAPSLAQTLMEAILGAIPLCSWRSWPSSSWPAAGKRARICCWSCL